MHCVKHNNKNIYVLGDNLLDTGSSDATKQRHAAGGGVGASSFFGLSRTSTFDAFGHDTLGPDFRIGNELPHALRPGIVRHKVIVILGSNCSQLGQPAIVREK